MSVNTMTFEQSAAFLTDLYKEATGQYPTIQIANTADFTTVATTLMQGGLDPVMGALSQVLAKTIFSIRPYSQKFKDLNVDELKWGSVVRKINYIDSDLDTTDQRMNLTDGSSIDQYVVKKPKVIQTNFYGATLYSDHVTIFKDQLSSALNGPDEFGRFLAGVMQNMADKLAQIREAEARGILANMIATKAGYDTANAINVLQAYYDETGVTLTPSNMFDPSNYQTFTRWLAAFMKTLTQNMAERTTKYHMNITGKEIMRHTEPRFMRKYLSANVMNNIETLVNSNIYNPEYIKNITEGAESVTYWQNENDPYTVDATPAYMDTTTGYVVDALTDTKVENIIGVLFDVEALGMTTMNMSVVNTPLNASGLYYNTYYHFEQKTWVDDTENFVLLYADTVTP